MNVDQEVDESRNLLESRTGHRRYLAMTKYFRSLATILACLVSLALGSHPLSAQLTYWIDVNGSTPGTEQWIFDQIANSMDVALANYNTFASYPSSAASSNAQGIRVIYSSGVPTANASYRGRIAFGGSRSGHTAMHEIAHVMGVGTHWRWDLFRDGNRWTGEHATAEVRDILNDPNANLSADGAHFWPFGLNGKDGDRHAHVRIVGALREDLGLSNGNPDLPVIARYSFGDDLSSQDQASTSIAADMVLGSKILHSTITNTIRAEGNDPLNETLADAAANGFTSDLSISSLVPQDLDSMTFAVEFNGIDDGESGTIVMRSSADSFQTDLLNFRNPRNGTTERPIKVDLSDFQDVTDLTFRFYFLGENNRVDERSRIVGPISVFALPTICDFNSDGSCDGQDIDLLTLEIISPTGDLRFDLDSDDRTTPADLATWLVEAGNATIGAPYLMGDANLDGFIDTSDLNIWNANKFLWTAAWSRGDFNSDGVVDTSDLNIWNGNKFTMSLPPSAVPEPESGFTMSLLFGLGVLITRRNRADWP